MLNAVGTHKKCSPCLKSIIKFWVSLGSPRMNSPEKSGKLSSGQRTGKGQFSFQSQRGNAKKCSNYRTIALISHASKVMLKILQTTIKAGFRWGRGTRDQIAKIRWIIKKAKAFQKNIYFCFIDYAKAFDCVDHNKLENSLRDGNTRPSDLPPEKCVCRSRSNS